MSRKTVDQKQGVLDYLLCRSSVASCLHACRCRGHASGEVAVTECDGIFFASTGCSPHDISANMVGSGVSWDAVIGKGREDWEIMIHAGTFKFLHGQLMQVRLDFMLDV